MSLILDALKKSEQERRRERVPDLQSIHQIPSVRQRRSQKRWGWLLLLLVNVAALSGWWWYQQHALSVPSAEQGADVAMPVSPASKTEPAAAASQPTPVLPQAAADGSQFTRFEPRITSKPRFDVTAPIEEFNELSPDVRSALPAMTFSFHVYSADPQNRAIIINNQRLREGDDVSAGVMLEAITEDGVVLAMDHHRIHINVLTGW